MCLYVAVALAVAVCVCIAYWAVTSLLENFLKEILVPLPFYSNIFRKSKVSQFVFLKVLVISQICILLYIVYFVCMIMYII